jgi:hypothetical protein
MGLLWEIYSTKEESILPHGPTDAFFEGNRTDTSGPLVPGLHLIVTSTGWSLLSSDVLIVLPSFSSAKKEQPKVAH